MAISEHDNIDHKRDSLNLFLLLLQCVRVRVGISVFIVLHNAMPGLRFRVRVVDYESDSLN